jgi:hypothetical protein
MTLSAAATAMPEIGSMSHAPGEPVRISTNTAASLGCKRHRLVADSAIRRFQDPISKGA